MSPKSLFNKYGIPSQGELVKYLTTLSDSYYLNKSSESVRSFLSQTMNGKRKLSLELKEAIVLCFKEKNKSLDLEKFKSELEQVFEKAFLIQSEQKENRKKLNVQIAHDDYNLLLKRTKSATNVSVITAEPAEIKNNVKADTLKHELLKKIGVIESGETCAKYNFFLAKGGESYNIPKEFWAGLYNYAKQLKIYDLDKKLKIANEGDGTIAPNLKVFAIDDDNIDVTYGIIDEGTPNPIGFVTIYNKLRLEQIEEISVSRMEGETLERIIKRLKKLQNSFPEEFGFIKALSMLT